MTYDWKPGFYKTRSGKDVEVLGVRGLKIIGVMNDDAESWDLAGRYSFSRNAPTTLDLVPHETGKCPTCGSAT